MNISKEPEMVAWTVKDLKSLKPISIFSEVYKSHPFPGRELSMEDLHAYEARKQTIYEELL